MPESESDCYQRWFCDPEADSRMRAPSGVTASTGEPNLQRSYHLGATGISVARRRVGKLGQDLALGHELLPLPLRTARLRRKGECFH